MSTPGCLIAHADWSVAAEKRWLAVATPTGSSWRVRLSPVGALDGLRERLSAEAEGRPILLGIDAPIGLPIAFAARHLAGHADFPSFLATLDVGSEFFNVCDAIDEVTPERPFFPRTTRHAPRRQEQADRLGVARHDCLLRRCDQKTDRRPRAACLFWTLGPNQVGKAAISLWRDLLLPWMRAADPPALWPFAGDLPALLGGHRVTIAETYPAEAQRLVAPGWRGSKRRQSDRTGLAGGLEAALEHCNAAATPELAAAIADGFGSSAQAEDQFDSLLGLIALLTEVQRPGATALPSDKAIRRWEGWILGQAA